MSFLKLLCRYKTACSVMTKLSIETRRNSMFHEIIEKLESVLATVISGIFLLASFILLKLNITIVIDPAWITIIISGLPLFYSAFKKLIKNKGIGKISSALLISIAMIAAILIDDLFAAGEVAFIMAVGEILEEKTTKKARKGLKKLIHLAPTQGRKIIGEQEIMLPCEEIALGDILRILPGETIPVDGVIIHGETSIDQSVMTGESIPVDKSINDRVFAGTINQFGAIDIRATKIAENSSVQRLIRMVKEAEGKKAPMQRIADTWASVLVPVALLVAIITFWVTKDIVRAVTVLVVFCPCALVLATPTAIMAAIGQATKHGVIIKSGEALENMGKVSAIAFDKTGTLTFGKLEVVEILSTSDVSQNDVVSFAASVESKSEHPLGKAIVQYAKKQNIPLKEISDFKMTRGKGVIGKISKSESVEQKQKIICGNEKFIQENNIPLDDSVKATVEKFRLEGKAIIFVATEHSLIGILALSDVIRPEAKAMILTLQKLKTDTVLLTGDNEKTAQFFASLSGVKSVFANLLPEEKVAHITKMQNSGKVVCMIGDGVNDAPALKTANVGIAMGTMGSDIAIEAADIALMSDTLSKLPYLKRLSVGTVKTIRFSIALAMFINIVAVILSVLGLLNPITGALVHNAGSVFVVMIAALLYEMNFDK